MALVDKVVEDIEPNTSEWIQEIFKVGNHQQAMIVQAHLDKHDGDPKFCTVCGDGAAPVYKLKNGFPFRIRLCDTCMSIQGNERFERDSRYQD